MVNNRLDGGARPPSHGVQGAREHNALDDPLSANATSKPAATMCGRNRAAAPDAEKACFAKGNRRNLLILGVRDARR